MRLIQNGGLVWGLGMYASGSTWLFNVLLKLAEAVAPDLPREGRFVASLSDVGDPRPTGRLLLVKSHETDAAAEAALTGAANLIVVSIRDPLDVVASVMQYQKRDFAEALDLTEKSARLCARVAIMDSGRVLLVGAPEQLVAGRDSCRNLEDLFLEMTGRHLRD